MKSTISLGVGYIALLKDCVFVLQLFFLASVRVCFELQPHSYVQVSLLVYFHALSPALTGGRDSLPALHPLPRRFSFPTLSWLGCTEALCSCSLEQNLYCCFSSFVRDLYGWGFAPTSGPQSGIMEQSQYCPPGVPGRIGYAMAREESGKCVTGPPEPSLLQTTWGIEQEYFPLQWLKWNSGEGGSAVEGRGVSRLSALLQSHCRIIYTWFPLNVWFYPVIFPQIEPLWMEWAKEWRKPLYLLK